jgi:hypothetical protein
MVSTVLEKPKATVASLVTGIVSRMPAPADEVKLVVLNSLGEVASERSRLADGPLANLSFESRLLERAGKEPYFLLVQGLVKGKLAWEQRLGSIRFHA